MTDHLAELETFCWRQRLKIESFLNPQRAMSYTHAGVESANASRRITPTPPPNPQPWQQTGHATGPRRSTPDSEDVDR